DAQQANQRLDTLERPRGGMQAAASATASGQRHVERVGGELLRKLRIGERRAAGFERGLERLLRVVDCRARGGALGSRQLAQTLQQFRQRAGLAEVLRLGILQGGGIDTLLEFRAGPGNDACEVIHRLTYSSLNFRCDALKKKGRRVAPPFVSRT